MPNSDGLITVSEALCEAALQLKKAGIPDSRNEAEIMLASILGDSRVGLFLKAGHNLSFEEMKNYRGALRLRENGCPAAYIKGTKEFYGFDFRVNREVLIPRPETELLVDTVIDWCRERGKEKGEGLKIIDLGTGSGAIAVTLALLLPAALLWAVDISPAALETARFNAMMHRVQDRIAFQLGDYWAVFKNGPVLFDVVVSNPPYIPRDRISLLPESVKRFEPLHALDGGEDGMDGYRRILDRIALHTIPPALVVFELGEDVAPKVKRLCQGIELFETISVLKDLAGYDRILKALI